MGGRPRRFLFLGDLRKAKGVLDLVRAAGEARRQGSAGQVLLAGRETEQGIGPALRSLIVAEGLEGTVRLAGFLTGAAKEQALADADCLVLPSYSEALPMAILEAMACGLPVIAASVGSIPSVIEDGVEGFLIPPGDADALARRMLQLSADAELCRRLGAAARLRVERQFSLDAMAGKILDVYRDILFRGQKP